MYFHKIDHPYNFVPLPEGIEGASYHVEDHGDDIFCVSVSSPRWAGGFSLIGSLPSTGRSSCCTLLCSGEGGISIIGSDGRYLLTPWEQLPFGVQRTKWLWCFDLHSDMQFYGMGEKNIGFEKSGVRTKFWNTDIWADFTDQEIRDGSTDPMYLSAPVLLIHTGSSWLGMIVPSAYPVFMDTGARQLIEGLEEAVQEPDCFYLGASGSAPELYLFPGDDPMQIVQKMQKVSGVVRRPPLWALGYHQSRWGYASLKDLQQLDERFNELQIPCDGLWLDIDYMDAYNVFSLRPGAFDDLEVQLARLRASGRRVVPILDPGVKADPSYPPCAQGLAQELFCKTGEGRPYIGFVWPGASYFPDFSLERTRSWWAKQTAGLAGHGFEGFWVDMNDPSTGSSELEDMLFSDGSASHESYHNVYGKDMMRATYDGLLLARPDQRPFVLSRSGCIGSSTYGAVWTGDNLSNYHHLRTSVEMALSLSLSGLPFIGPDLGGFGGDAFEENFIDWYKCCYLFPFMRNHSADGTRAQEPWAFTDQALSVTRTCIRARYTLLPYLYNLFIFSERSGSPILRPMLLMFPSDQRFARTADQFMVGHELMQAPNLWGDESTREVLIPEGSWVDLYDGRWSHGKSSHEIDTSGDKLHLFMRGNAMLPMTLDPVSGGSSSSARMQEITVLIAVDPEAPCKSSGSLVYCVDDGISFAYQHGQESQISLEYMTDQDTISVSIQADTLPDGPWQLRLAVMGTSWDIFVDGQQLSSVLQPLPLPGFHAPVCLSSVVTIG
jgi:alpha-glucosidase